MREIKFRAWNPKTKTMYPMAYPYRIDLIKVCDAHDDRSCQFIHKGNLELLQYTGRKDSNGIEIYEGDIVNSSALRSPEPITWCEGNLTWILGEDWTFTWYLSDNPYSEYPLIVVGNIYQNPELLEQSK